jgi:hypothetical protein
MARKKITTIEETEAAATPQQYELTGEIEDDFGSEEQSVAERLADLMEATGADCISRIYKEDYRQQGRGPREFLERVDNFVDEEYIAENYGGGRYVIRYEWKENGQRKKTTIPFVISGDYRAKNAAPVPVQGTTKTDALGAFLGNLTAEKIGGIMAAIQGIKAIFAPPPPPVDMTELIKALAAPRQNIGDAVLIKALEGVNRPAPAPAPSLLEQIKQINEVKDILGAENSAGGNDTMDKFINMGLSMLPALLQRNGGNYQAAGAAVKENPFINSLIEKDPELLSRFCAATADKYGEQAARDLAAGFGYSYENTAQEAETTPQIENKAAEPPKG